MFPQELDYFGSTEQQVVLNFRVDSITMIIERIQQHKVIVVNVFLENEFCKLSHIEDDENNRIEFLDPSDQAFSSEIQAEIGQRLISIV